MPKETESRKYITIPVTNEQKQEIQDKANKSGRKLADYVRRKALGLD